jgi:ribosome-associated translation inhibitor RaiA
MQEPLRLAFRNMTAPIGVEDQVRTHVADLERYSDRITGCSVVVEASNKRHHQGNLFHVRIDLVVPGGQIVVRRDPPEHQAHEELPVALHDAFEAVRRQLQDYVREKRGDVKTHAKPSAPS